MASREPPPGAGWDQNVSDFTDLFLRWGGIGDNIRAIFNLAMPVVLVDRFRGEDEGSLFGIQGFANGANNEFSAVAFGSGVNDWEIHRISVTTQTIPAPMGITDKGWHMFTPIDPYNPVVNLSPVGFFTPGLITNAGFTFGSVQGVGGSNAAFPAVPGPIGYLQGLTSFANFTMLPTDVSFGGFDPPIRIPADTTFTIQTLTAFAAARQDLRVSLIYNERPKR